MLWVILAVVLMFFVASVGLLGNTLVSAWIPYSVAALFGVAALPLSRRMEWFTSSSRFWVNGICGFFIASGVASFIIIGGNYIFPSESTAHREEVTVSKKYRQEHHRSRRVGRRYVANGAPYYTYHALVEMADGTEKSLELTYEMYNEMKTGSVREIEIERGLFGMPIIRYGSLSKGTRHAAP